MDSSLQIKGDVPLCRERFRAEVCAGVVLCWEDVTETLISLAHF